MPEHLQNLGDFEGLAGDAVEIDGLRYLVGKLSWLLDVHNRKLRLIGAVATYDLYLKFLNKFPSIEEDWDLEILPITSIQFSTGGLYPRCRSHLQLDGVSCSIGWVLFHAV